MQVDVEPDSNNTDKPHKPHRRQSHPLGLVRSSYNDHPGQSPIYAPSQMVPPKTISFRKDTSAEMQAPHSPPSLPTFERDGHGQPHGDYHNVHHGLVTPYQRGPPHQIYPSAEFHHHHRHPHPSTCHPPTGPPHPLHPYSYGYPPPLVPYSYASYPWPLPPIAYVSVEYITELQTYDVLSGRGGATNSYRGNRAFRDLVKEYQEQYLKAKKRDKPAVASIIVDIVRKRGGRFLRRCNEQQGELVWVDIGDERAREKTCQALREGAPEIRRQHGRKGGRESHSPPLTKSMSDDIRPTLSSGASEEGCDTTLQSVLYHHHHPDEPFRIHPWSRLLPKRGPVAPIALDQLPNHVREIYLRDFLPPTWPPSLSNSCL